MTTINLALTFLFRVRFSRISSRLAVHKVCSGNGDAWSSSLLWSSMRQQSFYPVNSVSKCDTDVLVLSAQIPIVLKYHCHHHEMLMGNLFDFNSKLNN